MPITYARNTRTIPTHCWHMEFIQGSSRKFYRVYVTEGGGTCLRWGRIHTHGQGSYHAYGSYDAARDVGLRQAYEKRAKGYVIKYEDVVFSASDKAITMARGGDYDLLDEEWHDAAKAGEFGAAKVEVLKHYADFAERIKNLLDRAETADLETLLDEFQAAEEVWAEISDKHAEVEAAMSLTKMTLMKKVMG